MGVVGTIVKFTLFICFLWLFITAAWNTINTLKSEGQDFTSSVTSTTSAVNYTTTVTTATDNMSLAQLETLSFDNATKCDGLLDKQSWDIAMTTSGNATKDFVRKTVYGFMGSTNEWRTFFRNNMSDPPAWLSLGLSNYTDTLVARLAARVMGTNNITLAKEVMRNYTSSVGGLTFAGLDFVSWGGLSGERVQLTTHNSTQAVAATFPGQIYQLYLLSQDCSYTKQQRAQFLGYALAMTSLVIVTSGKDGFGPKFEGLLTKLHLHDAWPKIKGYLMDIGGASPGAAYETTVVLATLAKKFPSTFNDVAPFTSDRIDLMIQALKDKGLSPDAIKAKVGELVQAANRAKGDGDVAEVADEIDYGTTGTIPVRIGTDYRAYLYSDASMSEHMRNTFLEKEVQGFKTGDVSALKITIHKGGQLLPSYHVYQGGEEFRPTMPGEQVKPGDIVSISIEMLPIDSFVNGLTSFEMTNTAFTKWVADDVIVRGFSLNHGIFEMKVMQDSPFVGVTEFTVDGTPVKYPGLSQANDAVYMEFTVPDFMGNTQSMRIRHDGFSAPELALGFDGHFITASLMSYDGFRLSIVYSGHYSVSTIYLHPPSELIYKLGDVHPYSGSYLDSVSGKYSNVFQLDSVNIVRDLEKNILKQGSRYDAGRLGAEIAYVIADKNLGLKNIILEEPAKGGRDLYTSDGKVAIQARLLTEKMTPNQLEGAIQDALSQLVDKLKEDYDNQPRMNNGYAILSYVDTDGVVKSIILQVPKP